ncbi:universal stress protein [Fulvivirga ligni]|uniref:universal stress protein n=1 Tax=Fulvivirga ligni TaxID=2904246 RepID=UPI001F1B932D|nr:universal stress protein [Fulvivirga ligni]UII19084.1 universal stress protein [Fulvivirga ligni]
MKRILVPIDFSEQAKYALNFAAELASSDKEINITVFHAVEQPLEGYLDPTGIAVSLGMDADLLRILKQNAVNSMDVFFSELNLDERNFDKKIEVGTPHEAIQEEIASVGYDLVIMGTTGASGFKEIFIGSNAEKVVRDAHCPVITLSSPASIKSIKNIVFASATLTDISEELITEIKILQDLLHAKLHIVRINTPNNFERDEVVFKSLRFIAERYMLKDYTLNVYNDSYEEQGIISFANEIDAGMIALGTHGRKGLSHLLSGSLAEDIVNHAFCPIWTFHISKHEIA